MSTSIGEIVKDPSISDIENFLILSADKGALPSSGKKENLTLEVALNKIKHRVPGGVKFSIQDKKHQLYIFTSKGMGKPNSICYFDVIDFCNECKNITKTI